MNFARRSLVNANVGEVIGRTLMVIRMAIGATPVEVRTLVLSQAGVIVGVGVVCGIAGGIWASNLIRSLLFGMSPSDPVVFIEAAVIVSAVGAAASLVPAWRASRLDPSLALREN